MNSRRLHTMCAFTMLLGGAAFGAEERPGPRAVMLNTNPQPVRAIEGDGDATLVYPATAAVAPFTRLPGTTVTFTWDHGTNAKGYFLAVSTAPGGVTGFSNAYTTGTSRTVTGIPCDGSPIYVTLWTDRNGTGFTGTPPVVRYDGPTNCAADPRAVIASPAPGLSFVGNSATFSWDAVAGAVNYTLEVGSTLGGTDFAAGLVNGTSKTVTNLPCNGSTVFARLWTQTAGGNLSPIDFYYKASTSCNLPTQAKLLSPAPNSTLPSQSVTFTWSGAQGAQDYWLDVGSSLGQGNFSAGVVTGNSKTAPIGCVNPEVYVRLWTRVAGVWQAPLDYQFLSPLSCLVTEIGQINSPVPGSTLTGSTVTFGWTAGSTALDYWLDIGTALGQGNIYGGVVAATSKQVTSIPCNGQTIHARLWTRTALGYQTPRDYTYTANNGSGACSDGRAQITTPVPGSVLTSTIQTFNWSAGTNAQDYWLDVGTALGQGNVFGAVVTGTSRQVSGIPCNNVPTFVRLWTRIGGAWQPPLDYSYTCNGSEPRAQLTSPVAGTQLPGTTVTFNWSTGTNAQDYWLDVGTTQGSGNISAGVVTGTSKQVSGIPNGAGGPIWVRLWTRVGGVWLAPIDYQFTRPN